MALLLLIDPSALDFAVERLFQVAGEGFVGQYNFWFEDILHDGVRAVTLLD